MVVRLKLARWIGQIWAKSVWTSDSARSAQQFDSRRTEISNVQGVQHIIFELTGFAHGIPMYKDVHPCYFTDLIYQIFPDPLAE